VDTEEGRRPAGGPALIREGREEADVLHLATTGRLTRGSDQQADVITRERLERDGSA
jgi:hypothetical protein